jgi:hypothetical protein
MQNDETELDYSSHKGMYRRSSICPPQRYGRRVWPLKIKNIQMKATISKYIVCILLLTAAASCKKSFLELSPISNANVNDFYKTAADINNAVMAAYSIHKKIYTDNFASQSILDEVRSDNTTMVQLDVLDRFIRDTGKEWYGWSWDKCYRAIYMCNLVLEKAEPVDMDETLKNQYDAEARFLRAITYFELVRNFGGVPLVTETTKSLDPASVQIPRNSVDEVYAQIITDLKFAMDNLPAEYSSGDIGRATRYAAEGMLGKVYLTTGDKQSAETALRDVVSSGRYHLLDTYAEVWDVNNRNSAESLFELQFRATTDPSPMENYFGSQAATGIPGGGYGYNLATDDLVNTYEPGDIRKDVSMAVDANGVYYAIKFNDPTMTSGFNSSHNFPILRYADVLLLLAEAIGESPEAYDLINQIRDRAHLPHISAATPGTFADKLLHERRVELAFENHRWHDLLRFGVAVQVMNQALASLGITINDDDLLMPIPQTAISTNPNLEQNPGY